MHSALGVAAHICAELFTLSPGLQHDGMPRRACCPVHYVTLVRGRGSRRALNERARRVARAHGVLLLDVR